MRLELGRDWMEIIPENHQDRAYLMDTMGIKVIPGKNKWTWDLRGVALRCRESSGIMTETRDDNKQSYEMGEVLIVKVTRKD